MAEKHAFTLLVTGRVMLVLGLLMIVATLIFMDGGINEWLLIVLGAAGISTISVGWHFATDEKYVHSYRPDKLGMPRTEDIQRDDILHDLASASFIQRFPKRQIPRGRVFLSRGFVKEMQKNHRSF